MIGAMATAIADSFRKLVFDKILGIERHEYAAVAWSFAYFFCVLSSYYIIRPVREEMAIGSGANTIPYLWIGTFITMIFATSAFGWVASRYPRRTFLPWVYLFFISNILIFWVVFSQARGAGEDYVWLGRLFYVWVSIFNLFIVSVFWSFMADIYTREQGRRLFGFIASGGSIGAILGGLATSAMVTTIGFQNLLPMSASILLVAIICIGRLKDNAQLAGTSENGATFESNKPLGGSALAGLTHLFSSKYFLGIALLSVMASLLGTALYMFRAELIETAILNPDVRTQFFSNMNVAQNTIAVVGQMFLVKLVVTRYGVGRALSLFWFASILGFAILAMDPTLMAVAILDVVRRGLGFGFTKPSTDMLYSVVTPEEKYKTKNAIDTAVYRGGDVVGSWTIKLLSMLGMGMAAISVLLVPFAAISAAVALWLGRDYKRKAKALKTTGIK